MSKAVICFTILLIAASAPAQAKPLVCKWTAKNTCNGDGPCKAKPVGSAYVTLDRQTRDYKRCDNKGCDTYQAKVNLSGIMTVFELDGRGVFAKVASDGSATEAVSLGTSVIVYHGTCR